MILNENTSVSKYSHLLYVALVEALGHVGFKVWGTEIVNSIKHRFDARTMFLKVCNSSNWYFLRYGPANMPTHLIARWTERRIFSSECTQCPVQENKELKCLTDVDCCMYCSQSYMPECIISMQPNHLQKGAKKTFDIFHILFKEHQRTSVKPVFYVDLHHNFLSVIIFM